MISSVFAIPAFAFAIIFLILTTAQFSVALTSLSGPSSPKPLDKLVVERRRFFDCMSLAITSAAVITEQLQAEPALAADVLQPPSDDDPFAQMDSIISNQVNSTGGVDVIEQSALTGGTPRSSDMEEALKSARNRKQVDPRTHG